MSFIKWVNHINVLKHIDAIKKKDSQFFLAEKVQIKSD